MNIEELINEIVWRDRTTIDTDNLINKLRTLLTTYTCEVAKIDEGIFYDIYMKMKINGVSEHVNEYNRLITEKYQAQPETPEPEQPSPNWWESLKEGDLVMYEDNLLQVKNWYQEQLGEKRVWIEAGGYGRTKEHYTPYTPTPTEAIADLKNGKITEEQFQKVYKG